MSSALSIRQLTKIYDNGFQALHGIDLDVAEGDFFALLGPNGAGKSTTIEILEGYRHRTSGDVRVLGVDPQRGGLEWKARLGIVLQSTGEAGNFTVRELLTEFAGYYPNPREVDEVIAAVGLEEKQRARAGRLSGGQQRRLDVALGIIGRPELLFLDEPTTGFDPEARRQFWGLIHRLKAEGPSIVLTTHYLDEAARLGDRAAVITNGRIVAIGPIDEIGGPDARTPMVRWLDAAGVRHEKRTTISVARSSSMIASTSVSTSTRAAPSGARSRSSSQRLSGCGTTPWFVETNASSQPAEGQRPKPEMRTMRPVVLVKAVAVKS
jgi:ABC-2 type transport system ATP-binding protein